MSSSRCYSCDVPLRRENVSPVTQDACRACAPALVYRLNVWVTVPITEGVADLTGRSVERQILQLLEKADLIVDCEVMDSEAVPA